MTRLRRFITAGLACAALCAQAAPLDLVQAYEAALRHDPQLRAAQAERDASREQATLGRAQLLPTVSAQYANSLNRADVSEAGGPASERRYRSVNTSVQLRQPLYYPEGQAAWRQGKALAEAGEAQYTARRQELITRVFEAFAGVLYAQEALQLARSQLDTLAAQQSANQRLLAGGEGTRTELLETRAKADLAQAQWLEAQDALAQQRRALTSLTGLPAVDELTPLRPGDAPDPAGERPLAQWLGLAAERNPVLQGLRQQQLASGEELRRAESGHQPRLDLVASTGRSESDSVSSYRQTYQTHALGIQLNLPLYAGGAVSAQVRQALARQTRAQAELDARSADVALEVERQHRLLISGAQRVQALQQAVAAHQLLVEATQKSVLGGVRTNLDLLNAGDQLVQARKDLAQARLAWLLAGLRLRLAAGVLEEDDLRSVASRFAASAP